MSDTPSKLGIYGGFHFSPAHINNGSIDIYHAYLSGGGKREVQV